MTVNPGGLSNRLVPVPAWIVGVVGGGLAGASLAFPWYSLLGFELSAFDAEFAAWGGATITAASGIALIPFIGRTTFVQAIVAVTLGAIGLLVVIIRITTESDFLDIGPFVALGGGALALAGGIWGLARPISTASSAPPPPAVESPDGVHIAAPDATPTSAPTSTPTSTEGMSTAALVVGIVGVVLSWFPLVGTLLALLATIFGAVSQPARSKKAMAGLVLGIIGLVLSVLFIVLYIVFGDELR